MAQPVPKVAERRAQELAGQHQVVERQARLRPGGTHLVVEQAAPARMVEAAERWTPARRMRAIKMRASMPAKMGATPRTTEAAVAAWRVPIGLRSRLPRCSLRLPRFYSGGQ